MHGSVGAFGIGGAGGAPSGGITVGTIMFAARYHPLLHFELALDIARCTPILFC